MYDAATGAQFRTSGAYVLSFAAAITARSKSLFPLVISRRGRKPSGDGRKADSNKALTFGLR
jgi:hypothetical protein